MRGFKLHIGGIQRMEGELLAEAPEIRYKWKEYTENLFEKNEVMNT